MFPLCNEFRLFLSMALSMAISNNDRSVGKPLNSSVFMKEIIVIPLPCCNPVPSWFVVGGGSVVDDDADDVLVVVVVVVVVVEEGV